MRSLRSLTAALLLATGASVVDAQEVRRVEFAEHGFSIAVPMLWQQVPGPEVEQFDRVDTRAAEAEVETLAAFQPFVPPRFFTPPYVLVKVQRVGSISAADLSSMARNPIRLIAVQEWLDHIAEAYGTRYPLDTFAWDDRDGILWMVNSGTEEPFPEIVSVSGAIPAPDGALLVAYRAFPHTDLRALRDTVRSILISVRASR
jgi:hypothetical protein